jgi:hypothetical protein
MKKALLQLGINLLRYIAIDLARHAMAWIWSQ